jgi:type IV pilus assembly protein PilM
MLKHSKSSIGLDIGTHFIKLVELKKSGDAIILAKFGIKEIPQDPNIDKDKIVLQLVSQLFSENNIKCHHVNVSAGGQSVFVRFIKLLQIKEEKLKQTMKFEAQNQIPFPLSEVAWDWSLLDRDKKTAKKAVIVAIKKNLVEDMIAKLKTIKLTIALIDISPIALYNCMAFNEDYDERKLSAILDIGTRTTNLVIFKQHNIWIRSFPVAAERIEEAGEQGMEEFISEIERSIEYYFMQLGEELQGGRGLEELILTGGGTRISAIESRLLDKFGVKPKILDPFRKLRISKDIFSNTQGEHFKNQFSVAVGLALRGVTGLRIEVNFLKEMFYERAVASHRNLYSRLSMTMAVLIFISLSIFTRQDYSVKRMKLNKIDEMLDIYKTYEPKIKKIQDAEDVIRNKTGILYQVASSRAIWLDVLKTISEILPKEVWITDLSCIVSMEESGLGRLDLGGKALSYQSVNSFVSSLKSSPNFKDVKPVSSSIETDANSGEEIVKFSITMDVIVGGAGQ